MWQAPALVVAAQSFLFLAALNGSFPEWGRIVVLIAGLFAVIAAAHSITKQRYLEELHSVAIRRCLRLLGYPNIYRDGLGSLKPTGKLYDRTIVTFPSVSPLARDVFCVRRRGRVHPHQGGVGLALATVLDALSHVGHALNEVALDRHV